MLHQVYQTNVSPQNNNQQSRFPMFGYASPQRHQNQYSHHNSPTSFMPSMIPESPPIFYTIDQHGHFIILSPPQPNTSYSSEKSISDQMHLSTTFSNASFEAYQQPPLDSSSSFYDSRNRSNVVLNTSIGAVSRKSVQSAGKSRNNRAYKTMMCNMFLSNGACSYGAGCQYAHGQEEIRPTIPHPKYKTQLCNKFNTDRGCQYGAKCHFRHPDESEQLKLNSSSQSSEE
jgi:hypothetical protein